MRTDRLYLADIVAAADSIGRFIADMEDDAAFYTDDLRQSAILQKLIVIGEVTATEDVPRLRKQVNRILAGLSEG